MSYQHKQRIAIATDLRDNGITYKSKRSEVVDDLAACMTSRKPTISLSAQFKKAKR